ncbi:27 kDa glycoprotein-like [Armigeres subalbatus]|uniref:27 kDa glycoprotein-like n=1 Tax=Armigeres subalbatus TaxID=124917 RepID=UPI002ED628CA
MNSTNNCVLFVSILVAISFPLIASQYIATQQAPVMQQTATAQQISAQQAATAALLRYREVCVNISGSDEGFYQFVGSIQPSRACVVDSLRTIFQTAPAEKNASDFFKKSCPKFNETVSCFDEVIEGIAKCTSEDYQTLVNILNEILYGVVELICESNGQLLSELQSPIIRACLSLIRERAAECRLTEAIRSIPPTGLSVEQCLDVVQTRECLQEKVAICNTPTLHSILEIAYDKLLKYANCNKVI